MVALTLQEACEVLDPPMSETQLRIIVRALAIQPTGARRSGQAGRPTATYQADELHRLHGALAPWLRLGVIRYA
jgi:hypothetical protein